MNCSHGFLAKSSFLRQWKLNYVGVIKSYPAGYALENQTNAGIYAQTVDRGEAEAIALAQELHADHLDQLDREAGIYLAEDLKNAALKTVDE